MKYISMLSLAIIVLFNSGCIHRYHSNPPAPTRISKSVIGIESGREGPKVYGNVGLEATHHH